MNHLLLSILVLLFSASLTAQVGVNNNNPQQALDVNGKIKVGNDGTTPDPGTIRFNSSEDDFEGHNGSEWQSLTKTNAASTARPGAVYHFGLNATSSWEFFDQGTFWPAATVPVEGAPLSTTQFFVVEKITITPTTIETGSTDSYYVGVARSIVSGANFNPQLYYRTNAGNGTLNVTANKAPLLVVDPGTTLRVWNSSTSPGRVRVVVFGVFVDDVSDYWGL